MSKGRLDVLTDLATMSALEFAINYEDVVINDGKIISVHPRERAKKITNKYGRRYCKVGF